MHDFIGFISDDIKQVFGNPENLFIDNIAGTANTNEPTLDWINPAKSDKQEIAESSKAKVMLVDPTIKYSLKLQKNEKVLIEVDKPKMTLAKIITEFFIERNHLFIQQP